MNGELVAERSSVEDLLAAGILDVEGRQLTGRDLLAAGIVSGSWQQLEAELAEGLGLVAAERPADAEVNDELKAFRLQGGLLSGEDMRAWLRARGLTLGAVKAYAARAVARRGGGVAAPVTGGEVTAEVAAEAICSGTLRDVGWWLADRMLSAKLTDANVDPVPLDERRIQQLVFEEARSVAGAAACEPGLLRAERLAWIAALDDAHSRWQQSVTSSGAVDRVLHERELDWCGFELDELRLNSPGAAAEAARQLAEGTDPRKVATTAGIPVITDHFLLVDAPPALARQLAGAVAGDVAGPWTDGDEHVVVRVRSRTAPHGGDEQLLVRARDELLAEAASRLRAGKVHWHERA